MLYILTAELQTAKVNYIRRKIQLSGFSAYPEGSPSQLKTWSLLHYNAAE